MHDGITILCHSLSIPKLLNILRTSPAFSSPLLESWDHLMMAIISRITNINFKQGDASWSQATPPVNSGGLGFQSASNLAPSAFLVSADGVSDFMHQLLPTHLSAASHGGRDLALSTWKDALPVDTPLPTVTYLQKSWDQLVVHHLFDSLLTHCTDQSSRALAPVSQEHGLTHLLSCRMFDDAICTAIGLRVGAPICLPHTCNLCGKSADEFGRHGLSCRSSQGSALHHQMLNNIIHRSLASANIPSRLEPSGLYRADGNCPDGVTMVPWSNGSFLVWDATCVDIFCDSHHQATAKKAGGAAVHAETEKAKKYAHLDRAYQFQSIAVETCGVVGPDSMCFLRDLGRRLKSATGEPNSLTCLHQWISVTIQVSNLTSILGSLPDLVT